MRAQNPALEHKYLRFFEMLETSLKNEFKNSPFPGTKVLNNYTLKHEYNVTIELILANNIKVEVICDTTFPNTDRPKIFCVESFASDIIDKRTREVKYTSFYNWTGRNSKIIDLVAAIDLAFKKNPPKKNLLMEENLRKANEIKALASQKLSQGHLGPNEMREINRKISELLEKGEIYAGRLKRGNREQNGDYRFH